MAPHFLTLPLEIRRDIYHLILDGFTRGIAQEAPDDFVYLMPKLHRVCKQVYEETKIMIYSKVGFHLLCNPYNFHTRYVDSVAQDARRLVTKVTLSYPLGNENRHSSEINQNIAAVVKTFTALEKLTLRLEADEGFPLIRKTMIKPIRRMRALVSKPDAGETIEELGLLSGQKLLVQIHVPSDVVLEEDYSGVCLVCSRLEAQY